MEYNTPTTNPFYFMESDELNEHHENHFEYEFCNTLTFFDWYDTKLEKYKEDRLKHHLLKESYHKTLHYSIHMQCCGAYLTDLQLILQCSNLFTRFCHQCHLF